MNSIEFDMHLRVDPLFQAPGPDPEVMNQTPFIILRHAVTDFNIEFAKIVSAYGMDS